MGNFGNDFKLVVCEDYAHGLIASLLGAIIHLLVEWAILLLSGHLISISSWIVVVPDAAGSPKTITIILLL